MTRVGARAVTRSRGGGCRDPRGADLQDVALATDRRGWAPRELPRPLTVSAGSRAAAVLDAAAAREALRQAALEDAVRQRAAELQPPSIETARTARRAAAASEFVRTGPVDDAEIEAHVRRLLRQPRRLTLIVFYEPAARDRARLPHDPFKAIIAPRPIGWISTLDAEGTPNLAPYSFFNAVADSPPIVMFSSAGMKDSASHALARGEFVWNLATYDLREAMNQSSAVLPRGAVRVRVRGPRVGPSRLVAPPRVAASPVALECVVTQTLELTDAAGEPHRSTPRVRPGGGRAPRRALHPDDGRVDTAGMRPIARGGYLDEYSVVDEVFHMARPR